MNKKTCGNTVYEPLLGQCFFGKSSRIFHRSFALLMVCDEPRNGSYTRNVSGYITAKPEKMEINEFINKHKIQEKILNSFSHLVNSNKIEDLNIENKEVSINIKKIDYKKTELNQHSFQTSILKNKKEIGYYAVIFTNEGNEIDDFFVIN